MQLISPGLFNKAWFRAIKRAMLRVNGLSVGAHPHVILANTTLSVSPGETLAVMGPSGCGKTTLLKAIAGFMGKIVGEISYNGTLWQNHQGIQLKPAGRCAALLFQDHAIWPHLSVKRQLNLVSPGAEALIERLGLKADALGRQLSGGEKQRLALGRIMTLKPSIVLLDEPFASLDKATKDSMIALVKEHQALHKCAIIIATHDESDAYQLGATVLRFEMLECK